MQSHEIATVPLEDWFEELADETLDPMNILIAEEETNDLLEETTMSTTTLQDKKAFDVKSWLKTAAIVTNQPGGKTRSVIPCPEWLTLKSGVVSEENAFVVTAGIIKAARQVIDAIGYTTVEYENAVEALQMQELRATQQTPRDGSGAPADVGGYNPDGEEYNAALAEATQAVEELEAVLANGERIMTNILAWIDAHADELNLRVETGYTVKNGPIGNKIRVPRYELLNAETLMYGIAAQREFIRNNR